MIDAQTGLFTVGVFQDVAWAAKALDALKQAGFRPTERPFSRKTRRDAAALIEKTFGRPGDRLELGGDRRGGRARAARRRAAGTARRSGEVGLAGTMRRVGFQAHDGRIFETLTARGGILVAIRSEPRAADALALFIRTAAAMRPLAPGPAESEDSRLTSPDIRRQQIRTRFEALLLQLPHSRHVRDNTSTSPIPYQMAEPTQTAGVRANASAGHLSVHVEGAHPVDIPFLFEQQQKRIAPAALASLVSHVFIVVAILLFIRYAPHAGDDRRRSCPSSRTQNIIWLSQPGRAAAAAVAATR